MAFSYLYPWTWLQFHCLIFQPSRLACIMHTVQPIDFAATALAQYSGYATVIDDFLTPAECQHLRDLATSTGKWKPAAFGFNTIDIHELPK